MRLPLRRSLSIFVLLALAGPIYAAPHGSARPVSAAIAVKPDGADRARLIPLMDVFNVRDLGGIDGTRGPIPYDRFIRSANPAHLTPADSKELREHHVVLDIDLRTAEEERTSPDVLADDPHIRYLRISLLGNQPLTLSKMPPSLRALYVNALQADQPEFKQVFEAIAAATDHGSVLYHCSAGKDRAGMVSAMLLQLAGVPQNEIVHNYAISAYYLKPMMATPAMTRMLEKDPAARAYMGSPPQAIEGFLEALEHRYGGTAAYLRRIGVPAGDITRIRNRLAP